MSYILDALRKADAERERDPARGIHAQPLAAQPAAPRKPIAVWAGAGVLAVALAGYAWSQRGDVPPLAERAPVAVAPLTMASLVAAKPAPITKTEVPAVTAAPAKAEAPPDRIYSQTELPPDVQQALPKLAISGGVYSENVAQRMLIVGGQVVNEGAELAPGLVLEQIRARNAVLRFRGYKYSVIY
jgi:general secretion pathway protein B